MMSLCKEKFSKIPRFFVPTILELKESQKYNLYILCISNGRFLYLTSGGYDGLGKVREKEFEASSKFLGFKEWAILNHTEL